MAAVERILTLIESRASGWKGERGSEVETQAFVSTQSGRSYECFTLRTEEGLTADTTTPTGEAKGTRAEVGSAARREREG